SRARSGTNVNVLPAVQRLGASCLSSMSSTPSPIAAAIASRLAAAPAGLGRLGSTNRACPRSAPAVAAVQRTSPIFSSSTIAVPRPLSARMSAGPTVGWAANGKLTAGVEVRTRAVLPAASGLSTNTVSGWPNSRAIVCIAASPSPSASNTTASGLPVKRFSVNTSSVANGSFMKTPRLIKSSHQIVHAVALLGPHAHERLPAALGDELAVLVIGAVVELDDAGARPRARFALAQHLGRAVDG